jgi:hypothetical protein
MCSIVGHAHGMRPAARAVQVAARSAQVLIWRDAEVQLQQRHIRMAEGLVNFLQASAYPIWWSAAVSL